MRRRLIRPRPSALQSLVGTRYLKADFEVSLPKGTLFGLTREGIEVEMFAPDGRPIGTQRSSPSLDPPGILITPTTLRVRMRHIWLNLPHEAERCRFTIPYSRPSFAQATMNTFQKWGLATRLPRTCNWICYRLPQDRRWSICRQEVLIRPPASQHPEPDVVTPVSLQMR
jgi:hypothetical protein